MVIMWPHGQSEAVMSMTAFTPITLTTATLELLLSKRVTVMTRSNLLTRRNSIKCDRIIYLYLN